MTNINESFSLADKVKYKGEIGYITGQLGDGRFIILLSNTGNTCYATSDEISLYNPKPDTMKPHLKFDKTTLKLLENQMVKCGIFHGSIPVKTSNCFINYSDFKDSNENHNLYVKIDEQYVIMPKSNIKILENINDIIDPTNYVQGVIINEITGEAEMNVLVNGIDYINSIGGSDNVRVIIDVNGQQELQYFPANRVKTLSV